MLGKDTPAQPNAQTPETPASVPQPNGAQSSDAVLTGTDSADEPAADGGLAGIESMSLKELMQVKVVSATQTEQSVAEAPASMTVLSGDQLRAWGYTSLGQALRHVVGFYNVDNHILPDVGTRGIMSGLRSESGLIKVLIDSHSVQFRPNAGHWVGPELVPLSAVERVEIIRGPSSALYGADAFLGVVNVITREDFEGVDATFGANRVGQQFDGVAKRYGGELDVALGGRGETIEWLSAVRLHHEDRSRLEIPSTSPAPSLPFYARDKEAATGLGQTSATALLRMRANVARDVDVQLAGYLSVLDRGAEFADWLQFAKGFDSLGRANENRVSLVQGRLMADVFWDISENMRLEYRSSGFAGGPTARDNIEVGSGVYRVRRDFGFRGYEGRLDLKWNRPGELSVLVGAELIYDDENLPSVLQVTKLEGAGLEVGEIRESTSVRQGRRLFFNPGAHLQAVWWPLEEQNLSITGGVRYDYHNIYGNQISGRLGGVYEPIESLTLKLLYGRAFKAPSPLLLYGVPFLPGDIIGNENLAPQFVDTVEAMVSYDLGRALSVTTGLAYNFFRDKAEFDRQGANLVARNMADVATLSWETQVKGRFDRWLEGYANFALLSSVRNLKDEGYRKQLIGTKGEIYPPYIAQLGLRGHPHPDLDVGVAGVLAGPRVASASNVLANRGVYALPTRFELDAVLTYKGLRFGDGQRTELRLVGRNLSAFWVPETDTTRVDPGFSGVDYPLAPGKILVQLRQQI